MKTTIAPFGNLKGRGRCGTHSDTFGRYTVQTGDGPYAGVVFIEHDAPYTWKLYAFNAQGRSEHIAIYNDACKAYRAARHASRIRFRWWNPTKSDNA